MIWSLLALATSFFISLYTIPVLIKVMRYKGLVDLPTEERKIHKRPVPTLGGIIIFAATFFSFGIWFNIDELHLYYQIYQSILDFKLLVSAGLLIFFVGIKDDLIGTSPNKKIIAHFIAGSILILIGNIRITGLHGIFGVEEIPYWLSFFLSFFAYMGLVNAINLIDGVDGLAGGVSAIFAIFIGVWFLLAGSNYLAILSFSLSGALIGFLVYNFSPAKIFMGDSGSLTIGLLIYFLSISLIELRATDIPSFLLSHSRSIAAMSLLVYPITDTLRVFTIRILKGKSPFEADQNHLHHHLLQKFKKQPIVCFIVYLFSFIAFALSFLTYLLPVSVVLVIVLLFAGLFILFCIKK